MRLNFILIFTMPDDIIVQAPSINNHSSHMAEVFRLFGNSNIEVQPANLQGCDTKPFLKCILTFLLPQIRASVSLELYKSFQNTQFLLISKCVNSFSDVKQLIQASRRYWLGYFSKIVSKYPLGLDMSLQS